MDRYRNIPFTYNIIELFTSNPLLHSKEHDYTSLPMNEQNVVYSTQPKCNLNTMTHEHSSLH